MHKSKKEPQKPCRVSEVVATSSLPEAREALVVSKVQEEQGRGGSSGKSHWVDVDLGRRERTGRGIFQIFTCFWFQCGSDDSIDN